MSDYISREAALEVFCRWCGICPKEKQKPLECDDILGNVLHSLPAADVRPVVHGRWRLTGDYIGERYQCSKCGLLRGVLDVGKNFCPNCGADMREEATP